MTLSGKRAPQKNLLGIFKDLLTNWRQKEDRYISFVFTGSQLHNFAVGIPTFFHRACGLYLLPYPIQACAQANPNTRFCDIQIKTHKNAPRMYLCMYDACMLVCAFMYVCIYVCMYACMHVCMFGRMDGQMCVCVCVCTATVSD